MKLAMNISNSEDSHECIRHSRISPVIITVVMRLKPAITLQSEGNNYNTRGSASRRATVRAVSQGAHHNECGSSHASQSGPMSCRIKQGINSS